jgi:hypothetical protein
MNDFAFSMGIKPEACANRKYDSASVVDERGFVCPLSIKMNSLSTTNEDNIPRKYKDRIDILVSDFNAEEIKVFSE